MGNLVDDTLDARILQHLRRHKSAGRGKHLTDLLHLSDDPKRQGRDIDRALQRLRKRGEISFDSKAGWTVVSRLAQVIEVAHVRLPRREG